MDHVRLSRNAAAATVIALGLAAVGAGTWMRWGHEIGLIVTGVLVVVYAVLLLIDVPEPKKREERR